MEGSSQLARIEKKLQNVDAYQCLNNNYNAPGRGLKNGPWSIRRRRVAISSNQDQVVKEELPFGDTEISYSYVHKLAIMQ